MQTAVRLATSLFVAALLLSGCAPKDDTAAPPNVAAPPADALRTESGLASKVLRVGIGTRRPTPTSTVLVHYTGWTTDGAMFDSSVARGAPISFRLNQVIPGWTEGVGSMKVGGKRKLILPHQIAYGARGSGPIPPKALLIFDVELIDIPQM